MKPKIIIVHSVFAGSNWYSVNPKPRSFTHSVFYQYILRGRRKNGRRVTWITIPGKKKEQQYHNAMSMIMKAMDSILTTQL